MLCSAWYHLSSNDYVRFPAKRGLRQHLRIPSEPRMAQGNSHASLVSPGRGSEIAKQTRIQGSLGQGSCNLRGLSEQRRHSKCYQGGYQIIHSKDNSLTKARNLEANLAFGKTLSCLKRPWNNGRSLKLIKIKLLPGKMENLK